MAGFDWSYTTVNTDKKPKENRIVEAWIEFFSEFANTAGIEFYFAKSDPDDASRSEHESIREWFPEQLLDFYAVDNVKLWPRGLSPSTSEIQDQLDMKLKKAKEKKEK